MRYNQKFTREELDLPLKMAGFVKRDVAFSKSGRYREGLQSVKSFGTAVKDLMPSLRKLLNAVAST